MGLFGLVLALLIPVKLGVKGVTLSLLILILWFPGMAIAHILLMIFVPPRYEGRFVGN